MSDTFRVTLVGGSSLTRPVVIEKATLVAVAALTTHRVVYVKSGKGAAQRTLELRRTGAPRLFNSVGEEVQPSLWPDWVRYLLRVIQPQGGNQ